jgi:hypothetical protein
VLITKNVKLQVQRLLATREDVFPGYTQETSVTEIGRLFSIQTSQKIRNSERTLYLMIGKDV